MRPRIAADILEERCHPAAAAWRRRNLRRADDGAPSFLLDADAEGDGNGDGFGSFSSRVYGFGYRGKGDGYRDGFDQHVAISVGVSGRRINHYFSPSFSGKGDGYSAAQAGNPGDPFGALGAGDADGFEEDGAGGYGDGPWDHNR